MDINIKSITDIEPIESERWRYIFNEYLISSFGRLISLNYNRQGYSKLMNPVLSQKGYYQVNIMSKKYLIHRLVAIAFIDNPQNKTQVNHIDFNRANSRLENLEWVTPKENFNHSIDRVYKFKIEDQPKDRKGIKSSRARLTESQVLEIRKAHLSLGKRSCVKLSKIYNVQYSTIQAIVKRRNWTHI